MTDPTSTEHHPLPQWKARELKDWRPPGRLPRWADITGLVGWLVGIIGLRHLDHLGLKALDRKRVTASLFPTGAAYRRYLFRFASLLTLSVLIAVMGLLADSTAVVIGAMLVAPLMMPILGVSAGLVMGWGWETVRHAVVAAIGAVGAVALAALASQLVPGDPDPLPGEVLARTAPNMLDLGIALVAGIAGAYAQIRKQAGDAIIGVAVAVALVPPLATVGILVQLGETELAAGAAVLFLANVVGIITSAAITFIVCGLVPGDKLLSLNRRIARSIRFALVAVAVMAVPLTYGRGPLQAAPDHEPAANATTDSVLALIDPLAEVVDVQVNPTDDALRVDIVVATPQDRAPDAEVIATQLASELDEPVEVTVQVIETRLNHATVEP